MSQFNGAILAEIRIYDDPAHPEISTFKAILPYTVLEAVIDTDSGKNLQTILTEQSDQISAAVSAAESAAEKVNGGEINAKTLGGKSAADFASANHTHTAAQISGLPTSLPANGGNADTVGGAAVMTTAALGLHKMASGTAAANSTNCPPGCWYGQYE